MNRVIDRTLVTITLSLLILFFLTGSSAALKEQVTKSTNNFIWSVNGGGGTVYLLGSIHVLKQDSYPLPAAVEDIYNCCRRIVFETDLDGMASHEVQKKMLTVARYRSGHTLKSNIPESTYLILKNRMAASGLSIDQMNHFKPWFVSLQIAGMELQKLGFDPRYGIDRYFYDKAVKDKKELLFLETNDYQIGLFAGMNKMQQEILLRQTIKELDIIRTEFRKMTTAWKTGSGDEFERIVSAGFKEYPVIYNRLILKRNKRWVSKIQKLLRQRDNVLVIVGSGHLVGKKGLPELFKEKGYRVEQM